MEDVPDVVIFESDWVVTLVSPVPKLNAQMPVSMAALIVASLVTKTFPATCAFGVWLSPGS